MRLTARTRQLEASPIAEAKAWLPQRTSERPLLDLSQAVPNYPAAPEVVRRIAEVAAEPDAGAYAPPPGLPALNEAFAAEVGADYGTARVAAHHVLPVGGCNQAFSVVVSALTEPGDEVIVPVPYYFNHDMWLRLDGIRPVHVDTSATGFVPDPVAVEAAITERTRAILVVSPGNPTGATVPPATIDALFDVAARHDLALVVDETYRNFRDTTAAPHTLLQRPDWEQTYVGLHSFSKDLALAGYRVGAVVAGRALLDEVMKLVDCVQISAPRIGQEAVVTGLTEATAWRDAQRERILGNLDRFRSVMADRPGGFELVSSGAFFGWVRHRHDLATADVVKRLVLDHDVLVIPGTAFTPTDEGWLRFSYANLEPAELDLLAERLGEFVATD